MSASGPNAKCRPGLEASDVWGRPDVTRHHETDAFDPKLTPLRREYAASTEERPAYSENPPCAGPLRPCSGIRLWAIRCDCRFACLRWQRRGPRQVSAIAQQHEARGVRTLAGRDRWAPAQDSRLLAAKAGTR